MFRGTAVVAPLAALALAATAHAGNGPGPKESSSSIGPPIVMSSTSSALSATSGPRYGDTITFNVSTTQTGDPFVNPNYDQSGVLVAQDWAAFWPSAETLMLSSPAWTSGAANCTANLVMYVNSAKYKVLASTSFHADA
jgi:hypothetical protein